MTTLVVKLPVGLAKRFARIANELGMSHDDVGRLAVRMFCRAAIAGERTNQPTQGGGHVDDVWRGMATLVKANGTEVHVTPADGAAFSLEELQGYVGGYIEIVPSRISGCELVVNEEGLLNELPFNSKASQLLRPDVFGGRVVGDAVFCTRAEAGFAS